MHLSDLTPELQEKVRNARSTEELVELAKSEGHELTDEQLEAISGGGWICDEHNPVCSPHYGDPH